jgi:hypothetical protein
MENISFKDIEELKNKYQSVSDLIDSTFSNDNMEKIIKTNEDVNKKIKSTEATIVILESQVKELEKLNETLERKCYKNSVSPNESRQALLI